MGARKPLHHTQDKNCLFLCVCRVKLLRNHWAGKRDAIGSRPIDSSRRRPSELIIMAGKAVSSGLCGETAIPSSSQCVPYRAVRVCLHFLSLASGGLPIELPEKGDPERQAIEPLCPR